MRRREEQDRRRLQLKTDAAKKREMNRSVRVSRSPGQVSEGQQVTGAGQKGTDHSLLF